MRLGVLAIFSVLWIAGSSAMSLNSVRQVSLQVDCPEPTGCFGLIGKALASAPVGSTIYLGPGVFYEQPLVIDRSLVLQGAGANLSKIRMVDPDTAVTIRSAEPVSVMLSGLAITAPPLGWDAEHAATQSVGIRWTQNAGIAKEQTVIIKESEIESYLGMEIDGWKGSLTIQQSRLWSIAAGILMKARGEIAVAVEDTSFVGPFRYGIPQDILGFIVSSAIYIKAVPSLGKAYVLLRNNEMRFWHYGLSAVSAGHEEWSRTEVLLIGNTIAYNREAGVYLVGDAQAELRENKIEDNKYGVELFMPPCVPINPSNILAFRGMVKGQENVIKNNKAGDLCPADYPWPPGFRK